MGHRNPGIQEGRRGGRRRLFGAGGPRPCGRGDRSQAHGQLEWRPSCSRASPRLGAARSRAGLARCARGVR
eukprot:3538857-Alexandrium_andersonii.AAC.1